MVSESISPMLGDDRELNMPTTVQKAPFKLITYA